MHKARNLFNRYTCSFRMKFIPKSVRHPPPLYCKNWTGHRPTEELLNQFLSDVQNLNLILLLLFIQPQEIYRSQKKQNCIENLNLYDALILNRFEKSWKNCKNVFPSFFFTFKFFETPTNPGTKWIVVKWKKFWSKVPVWDQATLW